MSTSIRWKAFYDRGEAGLARFAEAVFTLWSFVAHIVLYAAAWALGTSPHALFLNVISIEAVLVSLCVGINQRLQLRGDEEAQRQRDELQEEMEEHVKEMHEWTKRHE